MNDDTMVCGPEQGQDIHELLLHAAEYAEASRAEEKEAQWRVEAARKESESP